MEGSFTGETKDILSKARKLTSISIGAPLLGNMDGRFFLGAFILEEFLLGPLELSKMPGRRVSLSIGAPLGKLEAFLSWTQR